MIITFSGIDGSGKTTYADLAAGYLKSKDLRYKYRHTVKDSFYDFILHNVIGRLSRSSQRSLEGGLRSRENKISFFILKLIKKALLVINLVYFNLRYGACKGNTANNVICDRYFYDEIVQMIYLKLASGKFISFYKYLIIKPDITFFLKVKPEAAFGRKPEYKKDYFLEKCAIYERVYKTIPLISEIGNGSVEQNSRLINDIIKQRLKLK